MKKKFLALICMITCIFGLTACGSEETLTEYEQQKVDVAKQIATTSIVPMFTEFMNDETAASYDELTLEEIEYLFSTQYSLNVDGYAVSKAIDSFNSAKDSMGEYQGVGEAEAEIDDDQIIIEVEVFGSEKNAVAEVILSNDRFFVLESAALNPTASMGELMTKAALNTLIGMGTVFIVLILISLIISCFRIIPKLQAKAAARKEAKKAVKSTGIDNAVAQITAQEEVTEEADDLELVAVIAAAVAAYEGAASTDGFVVRSIRRRV
ncbi:MAG: OadG family transporter subunit [Acetatifactor sp.]